MAGETEAQRARDLYERQWLTVEEIARAMDVTIQKARDLLVEAETSFRAT